MTDANRYIGVMSGTSLDGVDVACAEVDVLDPDPQRPRFAVRLVAAGFSPYAPDVQERLRALREGQPVPIADVCRLHYELGEIYAQAVARVCGDHAITLSDIAAVGLHGQTVWHSPPSSGADVPATLQLGQPAVLSERLGVRVISDFRARDIAAGGEGAPLVPFADYALLASPDETRAMLNLGGIANVTYLPAGGSLSAILAFDTGPGSLVIDGVLAALTGAPCDRDGALAAQGMPDAVLLRELLAHPYFTLPPPKSTGAELFSRAYVNDLLQWGAALSPADLAATATQLTVESVARAVRDLPQTPACLIVGGGGAHNKTLMARLAQSLPGVRLTTHEAFGIPGDVKEALAFALLAAATLNGIPSNVPSATGARGPRLLGAITHPDGPTPPGRKSLTVR